MKKILIVTAILSAAAGFTATSALAGGYMKYGDIKGESRVRTSAGDFNNDGHRAHAHGRVRGGLNPANTLQAPHRGQRTEYGHARVRSGLNPANTVQAPQKEQRMLLPAVQKVRGHH